MKLVRILAKVVVALVALVVVALVVVYALSERRIRRRYDVSVPRIAVTTDAEAIARGKRLATIVAAYTDADWVRTLLHGVRPDSRSVVFMPSHDFHFTEEDTADLIAFFRALPPVDRDIPAPHVGIMARALSFGPLPLLPAELIDHEHVSFARPPQTTDPVVVGRHLAAMAAISPTSREALARLLAPPTSRRPASATGPMPTS